MQMRPEDRRHLVDVIWEIAEHRQCDEVFIRYDCGHCLRAAVWAPVLPKTREYASQDADRRRFLQHCVYVLTKTPGERKVQISVPEGRCRCCGRGTRQALYCGTRQMDLAGAAGPLEFHLHSATFLAVLGQVCWFPDEVASPPLYESADLLQYSLSQKAIDIKECYQWNRQEIEDDVHSQISKYLRSTLFLLLFIAFEVLYFCIVYLGEPNGGYASDLVEAVFGNASSNATSELTSLASVSPFELVAVNSSWMMSFSFLGTGESTLSWLWTTFFLPVWTCGSVVFMPIIVVLDVLLALPRYIFAHVVMTSWQVIMERPWKWLLRTVELFYNAGALAFQHVVDRQPPTLSQIPLANPLMLATLLSVLIAAISGPQPPSLPPSIWNDLSKIDKVKENGKGKSKSSFLSLWKPFGKQWSPPRADHRQKNGTPAHRGQKSGVERASGRDGKDASGRQEKLQLGRQDGKNGAVSGKARQSACCLCLDRPSGYILEPCGHRVVCGECAMQLVEAASRNRLANEASNAQHATWEKGGGACPSCGTSTTRAIRVFS